MKQIELLAPAKDFEHGCAAVDSGADALYVGAPSFGARSDAAVSVEQIERLCAYAHRFGVKVFVTLNTLLFEEELRRAERIARQVYEGGADALIIQDMAFLRMDLPPIELHASTQMCTLEPQRARFWQEVGFTRIILERAATLTQIQAISAHVPQTEIEAFIHGAICVAYSGRCYLSRSLSPRSGNRGACIQACRLPFSLLDESDKTLFQDKHLLSVRDMNLSDHLEAMIDAGVSSFKIEGRLKEIHYVRNIVGWYRRRLDELIDRRKDLQRTSCGTTSLDFTPDPLKSFSRGATSYFITGAQRGVASFDTPKSSGEPIGVVTSVSKDTFTLKSDLSLTPGDGICFTGPDGKLVGTNINRVESNRIYPNRTEGIRTGIQLFRNHDHRFVSALDRARTRRCIAVRAGVEVTSETLTLTVQTGELTVQCTRQGRFEAAHNPQQAEETLRTQLAKSGETIYALKEVVIRWDIPRFVPIALLNALRRDTLDQLAQAQQNAYTRRPRREENRTAPAPVTHLSGDDNVTNSLAERFYRDHGVTQIEPGYDLLSDYEGLRVMQMRYCLRREIGECLRENPSYRGKLSLATGTHRYELGFDCSRCEMEVIDRGAYRLFNH